MSYTQEERAFRLDTALGGDMALLQRFEGREAVSEPFCFRVRFLAEQPVDLDALLGTAATLTSQRRNEAGPFFHGHWWSLRQLPKAEDSLHAYEGELVPKLRFLALQSHCQIFHDKDAKQIVTAVLDARGITHEFDLQATPPKREYCVQYRETDLNFIARLLEEEGIHYYFRHQQGSHILVMSDRTVAPATPVHDEGEYHPVAGDVTLQNPVFTIETARHSAPRKVTFSDYNFTTPRVDLRLSLEGGQTGEIFDYPGNYPDRDGGDRIARIRLEAEEARLKAIAGTSACDGFRAGHRFALRGHGQSALNTSYRLLAVEHTAVNPAYRAGATEQNPYSNRFEAMPANVPYRPPRRARKALVHGTQTAVVTGPEGEEIYVDEYGRIRVRFFWSEEEESCWVRVAQTWAGKNWGAVSWPRVGQEVVVDFLEGDPDRPLVIGCVYNADQMPPFPLPENKTKSGVRSRSSRGGGASQCNEIHFEDKSGQEKMFIQAERDQEITVKHDRTVQIANDEMIRVGHNRTSNINTTDSITAGTNVTISAGQEIKLSSPGGSITIGPAGITIQSSGVIVIQGSMVKIN
jgi:type VI secretion system secreted protein VgrG